MVMKKDYISPEFEEIRIQISNRLLDVSTENVIHDGTGEVEVWG